MSLYDYWERRLDGVLRNEANDFDAAMSRRITNVGPYRVVLVTPSTRYELHDRVLEIKCLLARYRLDAVIEEGARDDAGPVPTYNDFDMLVVFVLDAETQALCQALASDSETRRKMLVCVPDDVGYNYLSRMLTNYGVQLLTLPRQQLAAGIDNRAGIDIVRNCVGRCRATEAAREKKLKLNNTYVFLLHGIRTRALWISAIREALEAEEIVPLPMNYGYFSLFRFLMPFHWTKKGVVSRVCRDIQTQRDLKRTGTFMVLAHSFGSYIVSRLLKGGMKFDGVVLCGSVVRTDYAFPQNTPTILNDVGSNDFWPIAASKLSRLYGNSGSFGFNSAFVQDRFHRETGHGSFLTKDFASKYWVPYFCEAKIHPSDITASPSVWLKILDRVPRLSHLFSCLCGVLLVCLVAHYFGYV